MICYKAKKIYSLEHEGVFFTHMIVEGNRVKGLYQALPETYKSIEVVDFGDATILPGFIDSHMHFLGYGMSLNQCDLFGVASIDRLKKQMYDFIAKNPLTPGEWIVGRGWNQDLFEGRQLPSRYDLDAIPNTASHPIILFRACGHIAVLNSKAIEMLGIASDTFVLGGAIDSENGIPTGILRESALNIVTSAMSKLPLTTWKKYAQDAMKKLLSYGITSIHSDDLCQLEYDDFIQLFDQGDLEDIRIYEQSQFTDLNKFENALMKGYKASKDNPFIKFGPLKILADGSLGARTAKLTEGYHDAPEEKGILIYDETFLDTLIDYAFKNDIDVAIHGIGDYTINLAIEKIAKHSTLYGRNLGRNAIVHCQIMTASLIDKMAQSNIGALVQPVFLEYDMTIVNQRVGKSTAKSSYAFKTMTEKKIPLAFGSDAPVEDPNPFRGLYYATTRTRPDGMHFFTNECLTLFEAYRNYTLNAAYYAYEESYKGLLAPGYLADFIILEKDPFEIDPNDLLNLSVQATYVDGRCVFKAKKDAQSL